MHNNPFYPSFSLKPDQFWGRSDYLTSFERAIANPNSPDRCFILTGTRGCGKTSLLHQYALRARRMKMDVIETTCTNALSELKAYAKLDIGSSTTQTFKPSVSIANVGSASLGEISRSSAGGQPDLVDRNHLLSSRLCEELSKLSHRYGLLLIIDEVQKITEDDMVEIANAIQAAITQGHNVGFVLAGLPQSYHRLRNFKRCTFLHRMRRVLLWCMGIDETIGFMSNAFAKVSDITLTEDQIYNLSEFSGGHPYLMQLVGYHLCELMNSNTARITQESLQVDDASIERAKRLALSEYRANVLSNVLSGVRESTRNYIRTAYDVRQQDGEIRVCDVNERLGKTSKEIASTRDYALSTQVLRGMGYGSIRFALPHYRYIFEELPLMSVQESQQRIWLY